MSQERTTVVRGEWIVAHDGADHRIIEDGLVVLRGDKVHHVGKSWDGPADETVGGPGKLVMPGLVSTHSHLRISEGYRMVLDGGRREFMRSGFTNYAGRKAGGGPTFLEPGSTEDAIRFCLSMLLLNGVTSIVEMNNGAPDGGEAVLRLADESGIRMWYSPAFSAADYVVDEKGLLQMVWDEAAGFRALDRACAFVERHRGAAGGRLDGFVVLNEFYASTPELRRRTKEAAQKLGVGITTHFSEQLYEFHDTVRKTGRTPALLLADEGFLGPEVILGHALYVAGHSMTAYPYKGDLEAIAESGASVAHSPVAYARRGVAFESFQRFLDHGINLSLGTDSYPTDLISEMRCAALVGKIAESNHEFASAGDVFRAATLGGAKAVQRDDLGRLSPGAKADVVVVDLDNMTVGPVLDPIRALVFAGSGDMVETVFVDGRKLVDGGRLLPWDQKEVLRKAQASSRRVWGSFQNYHWDGKRVDEVFPPSFRTWST